MTHRGVNQRVAGAVQRGNFQTAALDFLQKCFALCVIVDVLLSGRDEVAAAPAAGSQLNSVQTVSNDLIQHFGQRNLSEYIGANRKFHFKTSFPVKNSIYLCLPYILERVHRERRESLGARKRR